MAARGDAAGKSVREPAQQASADAPPQALERILYVWAIRHPASGYVQGINDLATPFFEVFLSAYICACSVRPAVCLR